MELKGLNGCSPLGFGNHLFGWEVLVMDGEVLLGQTVARCFPLWMTKCLPSSKEPTMDFFLFFYPSSLLFDALWSFGLCEDACTQPAACGIHQVLMPVVEG